MKPHLDLIVSCTDRKRIAPEPAMRVGSLRRSELHERFAAWNIARDASTAPKVEASSLYKGDHWAVALDLQRIAQEAGFETTLWVASAGWGLIRSDAEVVSYGATFAARTPDSVDAREAVANRRTALQSWWNFLTKVRPSSSLEALAKKHPGGAFLIVAGPAYLQAMEPDLARMREILGDSERVALVAGAARFETAGLDEWLLAPSAKLQQQVGGSLASLHIRVARKLLQGRTPEKFLRSSLRRSLASLTANAPERVAWDRTPMTDDEVKRFIRGKLRGDSTATFTRLLRALRDEGQACEHKRFRSLFHEVRHVG